MSLFNPWVLLGIVLLCASSFMGGVKVESDHRDAQVLTQERSMHDAYVKQSDKLRGNADEISGQLSDAEKRRKAQRQDYERQLEDARNANQLGKCQTTAATDGKPAVTVQLVNAGLWDAAIKADVPKSSDIGATDGRAAGTSPTFAPLDLAYANLGENGERWQSCRDQVKGWQALAKKNGWVK